MTMSSLHDIDELAALWAARLRSGALKPEQRQELRHWLQLSPEHAKRFEAYCDWSADMDASLLVLKSEGLAVETEERPARSPAARRWAGAGILTAAAAALAVLFWPAPAEVYQTAPGVRETVALADGSRVELNANSKLTVRLGRDERQVTLEFGEALFAVAKDPARPFTVQTTQGTIRVTGTVFNVSAFNPTEQVVTVLEGSVEVRASAVPESPAALRAGDQARLFGAAPAVRTLDEMELSRAASWQRGVLEFSAEPLRAALERFAAYHGCTIQVSPMLDGLSLGGSYDLGNLDGFLHAIEQVLPVHVLRDGHRTIRLVPSHTR